VNILNTEQGEKIQEIGAYLRRLRLEKSISLDQVAAKTFIRLTALKALEEGVGENLPEPVYIQGFIRRYADFLGLDGNALAHTFPVESPHLKLNEKLLDSEVIGQKAEANPENDPQDSPKVAKQLKIPYLPYILVGAAVVLGGMLYLLNRPRTVEPVVQKHPAPISQHNKTQPQPIESTKPTSTPTSLPVSSTPSATPTPTTVAEVATPSAIQKASPAAEASTPPATPTPTTPVQVAVELQGNSWVRVVADGKVLFEGILTKGTKQTWTAKEKLIIRSGNAGVVMVSVNNQTPQPLGEVGKVVQTTFGSQQ